MQGCHDRWVTTYTPSPRLPLTLPLPPHAAPLDFNWRSQGAGCRRGCARHPVAAPSGGEPLLRQRPALAGLWGMRYTPHTAHRTHACMRPHTLTYTHTRTLPALPRRHLRHPRHIHLLRHHHRRRSLLRPRRQACWVVPRPMTSTYLPAWTAPSFSSPSLPLTIRARARGWSLRPPPPPPLPIHPPGMHPRRSFLSTSAG